MNNENKAVTPHLDEVALAKVLEMVVRLYDSDQKHREAQAAIYNALGTDNPHREAWPDEISKLKTDRDTLLAALREVRGSLLEIGLHPKSFWNVDDDLFAIDTAIAKVEEA